MVAPVPTGASGGSFSTRALQCTQQRWNLKSTEQFPQWHLELLGLVRRQTDRNFLQGDPPPNPNITEIGDDADENAYATRKYTANQELASTHASVIYAQWTIWNENAYDIILGSVALEPIDLEYVQTTFATTSDGRAFYEWVIKHANSVNQSAQLRMKADFKKIVITIDMTAADIDNTLKIVQTMYPKIIDHPKEHTKPSITHAFNLFPKDHPDMPYLMAYKVMHETSLLPTGGWASFQDFRLDISERLACEEATRGLANFDRATQPAAFAFADRKGAKTAYKTQRTNCATCDVRNCSGTPCLIFGGKSPDTIKSPGLQNLVIAYRAFCKEKGHKTTMKGVDVPQQWWEAHKRITKRAGESRKAAAATQGEVTQASIETDPDDNYWDVLHSETICVAIDDDGVDFISQIQALSKELTQNMESTPPSPSLPPDTGIAQRHGSADISLLSPPPVFELPAQFTEDGARDVAARIPPNMQSSPLPPSPSMEMHNLGYAPSLPLQPRQLFVRPASAPPSWYPPGLPGGIANVPLASLPPPISAASAASEFLRNSATQRSRPHVDPNVTRLMSETASERHDKETAMIERDNALDRVRHLEQSTTILAQQLSSVTTNANDKEARIAKANEVAAGAISLLDMATRSKDELVVERDALAARLASKTISITSLSARLRAIADLSKKARKSSNPRMRIARAAGIIAVAYHLRAKYPKLANVITALIRAVVQASVTMTIAVSKAVVTSAASLFVAKYTATITSTPNVEVNTMVDTITSEALTLTEPHVDGDVAMPVAPVMRQYGLLFDSGCTGLLTNSTDGLLSPLTDSNKTHLTAMGKMTTKQTGIFNRTVY